MSTRPEDAADLRLRAVLSGLDSDLAHLRQLREAEADPGAAERALRARGELEMTTPQATETGDDDEGDDEGDGGELAS